MKISDGFGMCLGKTKPPPLPSFDVRLVWKDAKIGFVFVRRGIVPEATSTYHLPRLIGHSKAMSLFLTGDVLPASHRWLEPLWSDILDKPEDVLPAALEQARKIASLTSALSCAMVKALVWRGTGSAEEQHLLDSKAMYATGNGEFSDKTEEAIKCLLDSLIAVVISFYFAGPDAKEGVRSFMEKRPVNFTGSVTKDMGADTPFGAFYPWWKKIETDGNPKL